MAQSLDRTTHRRHKSDAASYEKFLENLSVKGRATVEKHDEACSPDEAQGYGELWKRLAGLLNKLAGHATEVSGQHAVKFHISDGKYKQQVFALEDSRQGTIVVYFPDVLQQGIKARILAPGQSALDYQVVGEDVQLHLEPIDAETRDLTICKGMVGWGRRALRAELSVLAKDKAVHAVEILCEMAAEKWAASQAENAPETK